MKKSLTKKVLLISGFSLFIGGCFWAFATSNNGVLTITTDKFTAVQNIQEVHFNEKQDQASTSLPRIGIKNEGGSIFGIGTVSGSRIVPLKNTVENDSSIVAGSGNKNTAKETSMIIGGNDNTLDNGAQNSVILGGKNSITRAQNNAILVSSGVEITSNSENSNVMAVTSGSIDGKSSSAYAGDNIDIKGNNSLAMGSNIRISSDGTFAFNGTESPLTVDKNHTFIVQADRGMLIGTEKSNSSNIKLTVKGMIRVGNETCSADKIGAIYQKDRCTCACISSGGKAVDRSLSLGCDDTCTPISASTDTCGKNARAHEAEETTWRINGTFCNNASLSVSIPAFPNQGDSVNWTCTSPAGSKTCTATRKMMD